MPVENERKYVLNLNCEQFFADAQAAIHDGSNKILEMDYYADLINQAYLMYSPTGAVRVRYTKEDVKYGYVTRHLCFKQLVGTELIEIEQKIKKDDFDKLWSVATHHIRKIRYIVYDMTHPSDSVWEIDFLKDENKNTYFALAECELEPGRLAPHTIPWFITDHLLYEVPQSNNSKFSNLALSDMGYACNLYTQCYIGGNP